ncbi:required for excision 1-B domain-containing protein-like isoform X1 [Ostrea edulis]|uniref:required for excision 1-B domain-containing protein-like isoform X1 n=1 Tax=Ostrea edulis TaxID=37623 RepID=UPI0024AEE5C7|nr:required for excision 1-B domain-containing protein-like isoform X1 [Ostrea edulis]
MAEENKGFEGLPAKELLKRFHSLQGERVETYGLFEEGFQAYLNGAPNYNFPMYKQLVHEITQTFSKISQDIILITNQLEDNHNLTSIASIVTGIQNNEKEKLEKTVKLQLARQNATDNPEDSSFKEEEIDLKQRYRYCSVKCFTFLLASASEITLYFKWQRQCTGLSCQRSLV